MLSPRGRPWTPSVQRQGPSGGHATRVIKWTRAYCQTGWEVQKSTREDSDAEWTAWASIPGQGRGREYWSSDDLDVAGEGLRMRVRVENRAGWSRWSYPVQWTN